MLVDYEAVLLDLKRHLATKPHHGQRELAVVIAQLEVKNRVEEGMPDRALRLYGLEFFEEAITSSRQPPSTERRVAPGDGHQVRALRGDSSPQSEEDTHGRRNSDRASPSGQAPSRSRAARGRATAARPAA